MAIEYVNRKGDRYYLQAGRTKTGKPHNYFGRKLRGTPLERLPEGHEIYESPEAGQVFRRKIRMTKIRDSERELVYRGVRECAGLERFIVDVEPDSLVVYLPNTDDREVDKLIASFASLALFPSRVEAAKDQIMSHSHFSKMMRFVLEDAEERLCCVQRWCFRGAIDDWIWLDGPAPLPKLVNKHVKHLGKESFYELI